MLLFVMAALPGSEDAQCRGKVAFDSRAMAKAVARRMSSRGKVTDSYKCPYCSKYHIGSQSPPKMKRRLK